MHLSRIGRLWTVAACAVTAVAFAADPEPKKSSIIMEKKLEYSQNLLRALMTEDYDEVERNVTLMKTFTRLEEMYRSKKPAYRAQLTKFQEAVDGMAKAVEGKNYDGASAAYVSMVQSCIGCHKTLRQE
jgi:cytochrome c556